MRERLEDFDPNAKTLKYSIVDGPLPVKDYLSTVCVTPFEGGQAEVLWSSTFEPFAAGEAEAPQAIEGVYQL